MLGDKGVLMELKVVELFAGVGGFRVGLNHIKKIDKTSGNLYGLTNGNLLQKYSLHSNVM